MKEMKIDIPYYEDMTRYSNSDIGFFIKNGPKKLRDYKDGKIPSLNLPQLKKGTMIHEYILQLSLIINYHSHLYQKPHKFYDD